MGSEVSSGQYAPGGQTPPTPVKLRLGRGVFTPSTQKYPGSQFPEILLGNDSTPDPPQNFPAGQGLHSSSRARPS